MLLSALPIDALPDWFWVSGLTVLGAIIGSFVAALVIRWRQGRSVLTGRSACEACGTVLGPRDLVPLLSALASGGECRHCGARIDSLHGWVELIALLIGLSAALLVDREAALAVAVFGWLLLALAALDWTEFWLPDRLTLALALAGVAGALLGMAPALSDRLIGGASGFAVLWAIGASYRMMRGREGLGGGDPKLLGAIGLWTGWQLLPVVVTIAAMVGLGVVLFRMATGQAVQGSDRLPFGVLLAIAAYPAEIAMLMSG